MTPAEEAAWLLAIAAAERNARDDRSLTVHATSLRAALWERLRDLNDQREAA